MATIIVLAIIALGCYIYYLSNGNPSLSLFLLYLEK